MFEVTLELTLRSEVSSIILFNDEIDRQNALILLKAKEGIKDFHIHQIFFEKEHFSVQKDFGRNLVIGLVCGKLNIRKGPLLRFNGGLHNLKKVCKQITFPGAKICHVTEGNATVIPIHSKDLTRNIIYYCTAQNIATFKEDLKSNGFTNLVTEFNDPDFSVTMSSGVGSMMESNDGSVSLLNNSIGDNVDKKYDYVDSDSEFLPPPPQIKNVYSRSNRKFI